MRWCATRGCSTAWPSDALPRPPRRPYLAARLGEPVPRDAGLVESAVARPRTTVFGDDAYPDLHTKAASLLHSLARNHAFIDGNKRVSWLAAGAFYWIYGYELDAPEDPAYDLVLAVATGDLDVPEIANALAGWVVARRS